jgi:hypothetical protein
VTQPIEQARDYMLATFDFLLAARDPTTGNPNDDNRLVQRWFWYSLDDHLWRFGGSLFDPESGQRTLIGEAFANYVAAAPRATAVQLLRPAVGPVVSWPRLPGQPARAQVVISNAGDAPVAGLLVVGWYVGDPAAGGVLLGQTEVPGPLPGCGAVREVSAWLPTAGPVTGWLYAQLQPGGSTIRLTRWPLWPAQPARQ